MKILVVTPACHFPITGATQQDIYTTIELLQTMGHTVALYTLDRPGQDHELLVQIGHRYGIDVRQYRPSRNVWQWAARACVNPALFDRSAAVFDELVCDSAFLRYVDSFHPDLVLSQCTYSWPVVVAARDRGIRCVIRSHNLEPMHFWEELEPYQRWNPANAVKVFAKWLGERRALASANAVAAISPAEAEQYQRWQKGTVHLLPLVSLCRLLRPPRVAPQKKPIDLFYLGASYNVPFHLRGAKELIEEIAPRVIALAPGAFRFHVCGAKLPQFLVAKCNTRDIIYEGFVSNLEQFFERMDAGVFPVWSGRGMKQKIFEAVCRSFPVVAPRVALGGYQLVHGIHALIVNNREECVDAILSLRDSELRQKLEEHAYAFATANFTEEHMKNFLRTLLL